MTYLRVRTPLSELIPQPKMDLLLENKPRQVDAIILDP